MKRAVGFLAMSTMLGCASLTFPDRVPSITGEIIEMGEDTIFANGDAGAIWVKESPTDPCGIVFRTHEAEIGDRLDDGSVRERGVADLAVGQQVRVWAGAIADSCPAQGIAEAIEIVSG